MNLDEAVKKHIEWRAKFRLAIVKKEQMDAATISKDNCCEVGKWLHGEGKSRWGCLLYTSPSPRDRTRSRMPSSA